MRRRTLVALCVFAGCGAPYPIEGLDRSGADGGAGVPLPDRTVLEAGAETGSPPLPDSGTTPHPCPSSDAGDGKTCAGQSCAQIHGSVSAAPSGVYTIDPDGSGPIAPLSVYCDMTSDGGGWTLVHKNDKASTNDRTDDGYNVAALLDPTVNGVAVLPRSVIAAISPRSEFRVLSTNGYKIYSSGGYAYYTTDKHDG